MIDGELQANRGVLSRNYYYIRVEDFVKIYRRGESREMDPDAIETKIAVYEDRINNWLINVLVKLKDEPDSSFAAMQIAAAYIEGNQRLRDGGSKNNAFVKAAKRILSVDSSYDKTIRDFYRHITSGNFNNLVISNFKAAVAKGDYAGKINVNPKKFVECVEKDLRHYINDLKKNRNGLRKNFDKLTKLT
jgi:hypothetical protein